MKIEAQAIPQYFFLEFWEPKRPLRKLCREWKARATGIGPNGERATNSIHIFSPFGSQSQLNFSCVQFPHCFLSLFLYFLGRLRVALYNDSTPQRFVYIIRLVVPLYVHCTHSHTKPSVDVVDIINAFQSLKPNQAEHFPFVIVGFSFLCFVAPSLTLSLAYSVLCA